MKIIELKKIKLFENLSQLEIDNKYFDFHNDFTCSKVLFEENILTLFFNSEKFKLNISFKFINSVLTKFDFSNFESMNSLTIDNLYRGRFLIDDLLQEFDENKKSYYYIDFYEGLQIELRCESLSIIFDNI